MIKTKDWTYIHIPKNGGMNLKHNARLVYPDAEEEMQLLKMHNTIQFWDEDVEKSFTIVRNPYNRAISMWAYALNSMPNFVNVFGRPSFKEFWNNRRIWEAPASFRPDVDWTAVTNQVDFITDRNGKMAKFYKLEYDLPELEERIGVKLTNTQHNSGVYDKKEYYDDDTRNLIYRLFEDDFLKLGYNV